MALLHSNAPHAFLNPTMWFVIFQTHEEPVGSTSPNQVQMSQLQPDWQLITTTCRLPMSTHIHTFPQLLVTDHIDL